MSETSHLLGDMTERLLARHLDDATMRAARGGEWPGAAWQAIVDQGLLRALVDGEQGFGIPIGEGLDLVRQSGRWAMPLPLAETMAANAILARAGLPVVDDVIALVADGTGVTLRQDGTACGEADRIAWGRHARALVIEVDGQVALMTSDMLAVEDGANVAGMPRDRLRFDGPAKVAPLLGPSVLETGALIRALAMAGALQTLVALTIGHVTERKQFGRPLSAFQAIQHNLARLAGEAAAASAAADLAADAFATGSPHTGTAIAAARARIGEAAGIAIGIAHQLHGAIGFTEEHRLHWFTTALWSWRDEFGSSAFWTRRLGAEMLAGPASSYWPHVTAV